ncbi:MAG: hypothetical protein ACKPKO_24740, partial [Candidatus Fonsibacter sp.]
FGTLSGLKLNIKNTVIIPLWLDEIIDKYRDTLFCLHRLPRHMCSAMHGAYLGLAIGPERQGHIWVVALDKFATRAASWRTAEQGLRHSCMLYNTFVVTVLSHIWQ